MMKRSKKIALSGISAAFASLFLALGNTIAVLDYSLYLLASLCIMVPFVTGEIGWSFFSFVVSAIIGLIFAPNILNMVVYFAFFGSYAIVVGILMLKCKKVWLEYLVKNIFYATSITIMYFFSSVFLDINAWNLPIALLIVGAFVLMNAYDFFMKRIVKVMFYTIKRITMQ